VRARKHILWSIVLVATLTVVWPARADAQWHYHGPVRTSVVVGVGYPFFDPWYGYYGYPSFYGPPYPYPYPYYAYDPGASIRVEVKPREAEVYVDGYYAGKVDDFDGIFQRLPVTPGEHDIELYLEGYRAAKQHVLASPRHDFKLKYAMEKLGPGEQTEPRPQPAAPPSQMQQPQQQAPVRQPPRRIPQGAEPPPAAPPQGGSRIEVGGYGSISIRVQPADAEILVDGQAWRGPDSQNSLVIDVAEGRHTIEIQKSGYRTYVTDVDVRRGETTTLNVSLRTPNEK
jgi:PEGA domain-containing protein